LPINFASSFLLVIVLFAASVVSGRLLCGAFGIRLLNRFSSIGLAASAIFGTAFWVLAFGVQSYAGLTAPQIARVLLGAHFGLFLLVLYRRRTAVLWPTRPVLPTIALVGVCMAIALVGLLPVLRGDGYDPLNDSIFYCAHADWMQEYPFGLFRGQYDDHRPISGAVIGFEEHGLRMGANFFLALVQAGSNASCSMLVFPAVMTFGLVLSVLAFYLCGRWALNLPPWVSIGGCIAFALIAHPLFVGAHTGFLAQMYGVPALFFLTALLSRSLVTHAWDAPTAALIGLASAFMLSTYNEMLPLAVWLMGWFLSLALVHAIRQRSGPALIRFTMLIVVFGLIFTNVELDRARRALPSQLTSTFGSEIRMSKLEFSDFALGCRLNEFAPLLKPWDDIRSRFSVFYFGLAVLGVIYCIRARQGALLLALGGLMALLAVYFAFFTKDPFTGRVGHTWNLFKLAQWAYPFVLILQVAGIYLLIQTAPSIGWIVLTLAALNVLMSLPQHWGWSVHVSNRMRQIILSDHPMTEIRQIKKRLLSLPEGTLHLVDTGAGPARDWAGYIALLAFPRPIVGNWAEAAYIHGIPEMWGAPRKELRTPMIPLVWGTLRCDEGFRGESLGGGVCRFKYPDSTFVSFP
jgi:hypothetical protein